MYAVTTAQALDPSHASVELLVRRQRQELDEIVGQRHLLEQCARLVRPPLGVEELVAHLLADLVELLAGVAANEIGSHGLARIEPRALAYPLPDLRSRDLGRGGVLHQVEDRR